MMTNREEMTKLYIDNEHCESIEQLKGYFNQMSSNQDIYKAILEYGKDGDIAAWLKEKGEVKLSVKVEGIDRKIGDSEYMNHLTNIFNVPMVTDKPAFSDCASLNVTVDDRSDEQIILTLSFTIISSINESYYVNVETGWGHNNFKFNPECLKKEESEFHILTFKQIEGKEFGEVKITIDNDIVYDNSPIKKIIKLNSSQLTMVHIPGNPASDLSGFYISNTPVTIDQFEALTPALEKDWVEFLRKCYTCDYNGCLIVSALSVNNVLSFFKEIELYHLPSREQWIHLFMNYRKRVCWCHNTPQQDSYNKINWEMTNTNKYEIYCLLSSEYDKINKTMKIIGGNFPDGIEMANVAFRLVCTEAELDNL